MKKDKELLSFRETWQLTKRACKLWNQYAPNYLLSILLSSSVATLTPYVGIYFSAQILNELSGARDLDQLRTWILLTISVTAALTLLTAILRRWKNVCGSALLHRNSRITTDKMLSMDFAASDAPKTHELLSKIKQNSNFMGHGMMRVPYRLEPLIQAAAGIIGALLLTVTLFIEKVPDTAGRWDILNNPFVTGGILFGMLSVTLLAPVCRNKSTALWMRVLESIKTDNSFFMYFGHFAEDENRRMDIRMYEQDRTLKYYQRTVLNNSAVKVFGLKTRGPIGFWRALSESVSVVFMGLAYIFVCLKAWAGAFGVGSVAQYVSAITSLSSNLGKLLSTWGELRGNAVILKNTFEFLDIPNEMYQGTLTTEKRSDRKYEIEFRDVSFKYPGATEYALQHVSMKFRIGERLAVVGQNGSGKTTFIKLLCRLYDPTEGVILLNGIDIRKYSYDEYIALFSIVFQDFQLMSFSLGENVAAAVQYDANSAAACLDKAGFSKRLKLLPKGLETVINKDFDEQGVQVSGGEAQKIALARALYKDAPFVILDEPTAALDPIAEMEVYTKFDEICGAKTAVYISHRLSSCKFCDAIMVFHEGQIVQQGSHDELVSNQHGKYYELWHAQAQYYLS